MPVTVDSQCSVPYSLYSPIQYASSSASGSHTQGPDSATASENHSYRDVYGSLHEQAASSFATGHVQSPKRSPSLLRRINAAMKTKTSPSISSTHQDLPLESSAAVSRARVDPMYAAPSTTSTSRSSGFTMNPVSRFRRSRNAAKDTLRREQEAGKEHIFPPEEVRVDAQTGQSSASARIQSERRRSTASGGRQDANRRTGTPLRHARTESEVNWHQGGPERTTTEHRQTNKPLHRSNTVGTPTSRSRTAYSPNISEYNRECQHAASERRTLERPGQRTYEQNARPGNPPRMGRYGVYASPPTSVAQISTAAPQESWMSRRNEETKEPMRYSSPISPIKRVEGWEVQIAPDTASTRNARNQNPEPGEPASRPRKAHDVNSDSPSRTLVTDHPLSNRALPLPPDSSEAEKAKEFAMNLTKRMSMLLNADDVIFDSQTDFTSAPLSDPTSSEDAAADSPSASTSGTTTPTPPATAAESSTQPTSNETDVLRPQNADTSSPFGTLLANAREMNDAFVRGTESVWGKLFGRDKGKGKEQVVQVVAEAGDNSHSEPQDDQEDSRTDGEGSEIEGSRDIMLYSPLIPDADSIVEVAASEVVTLYGDGADEARERAYRAELRRRWADGRGFISLDALSTIEPVVEETGESDNNLIQAEQEHMIPAPDTSKLSDGGQTIEQNDRPKPKEKVIWVPSSTQISVQVLWWGYRIYLPPPVLHVLNSRTIETAKRAALLTSALTWLLENLPFTALPAALAPAALLLKALVPLLGMIGAFISWSWKATVTFDRGNGVVLSATWLLPIVLVPGTWEESEVPPPPLGINVDNTATGSSTS